MTKLFKTNVHAGKSPGSMVSVEISVKIEIILMNKSISLSVFCFSHLSSPCCSYLKSPSPNCIDECKLSHVCPRVSKDMMDYNNQTIFHESQLAVRRAI